MADTALERFKKDQEEQKQTKEGEIRNLDEFQQTFLSALESIGEPKKPVKYVRPLLDAFKGVDAKDTSVLRFALSLDPALKATIDLSINQKRKEIVYLALMRESLLHQQLLHLLLLYMQFY